MTFTKTLKSLASVATMSMMAGSLALAAGGEYKDQGQQQQQPGAQQEMDEQQRQPAQAEQQTGQPQQEQQAQQEQQQRQPAQAQQEQQQQKLSQEQVRQLQQKLQEQGYYQDGNIDGVMGPNTQQALRRYQQDQGIEATGEVDQQTISELGLDFQMEGERQPAGVEQQKQQQEQMQQEQQDDMME